MNPETAVTDAPPKTATAPRVSVGSIVHYVNHGMADGATKDCRAAIVTEVPEALTREPMDGCPNGTNGEWIAGLAVLNPTGTEFHRTVPYNAGDAREGAADCSEAPFHGDPFRYCACGWVEASPVAGTWHWPEPTEG